MRKRKGDLLKTGYESTLDNSLASWTDIPDYFPTIKEAKKAIMNTFKPEAWYHASSSVAGKGEIDEDFAIREACLCDSIKFMNRGWINERKIRDYANEAGTQINPYQTLYILYSENGPEAVKPFFTENGLDEIIKCYRENLIVRDGVIFLNSVTLKNALVV